VGRPRRSFLISLAAAPLLPVALTQVAPNPPSPAPSPASPAAPAPQARPEIAAAVQRGVAAYNAQDLAYYQASLTPDAVYIMDNGLVLSGRENILALLNGFFSRTPKPQLVASDVVTGGRGDVAWARFKWTPSHIENSRPGMTTAIFVRGGAGWQVVSIQLTRVGHATSPAIPTSASHPSHQGR
jgi:uncharacterized protein (TIGR02246 family)